MAQPTQQEVNSIIATLGTRIGNLEIDKADLIAQLEKARADNAALQAEKDKVDQQLSEALAKGSEEDGRNTPEPTDGDIAAES